MSFENFVTGGASDWAPQLAVASQLPGRIDGPADPIYLKEYVKAYCEERRSSIDKATRDRAKLERAVSKANAHFERLLDLYGQAVIDGPKAEKQISDAQTALRAAEANLAQANIAVPVVEMHPQAITRYAQAVDTLVERFTDLSSDVDRTAIKALRALVAYVIVKPRQPNGAEIEVVGHLSALIGENAPEVGGPMVAEEGLEPPTRGL